MSNDRARVAVAYGDGIGPEIMDATLRILQEAGAKIAIETIEVGGDLFDKGYSAGIPPQAWDTLYSTKTLLKAPITTPQGGGYKSLNVTLRRAMGMYANIRPCVAYHPFVKTHFPDMDVVIIRENSEGLYAGIEHQLTPDVQQCLKLFSRTGCEQIIRYAFEYAKSYNRQKVTCFSKDNIMKMTDGMFHKVFRDIATDYPDIESDHFIVDIGTAKLAAYPDMFDVIVTSNLYGDIISDVAAEISGSVGMAGSANIGKEFAMFEAVHGSAPDIAGQNIANPSGLLNAAIMMLVHLGQANIASYIHNGWLCAIEDGIHTADIYQEGKSKEKVGTAEFAEAVCERMEWEPRILKKAAYGQNRVQLVSDTPKQDKVAMPERMLCGVDVFVHWTGDEVASLADQVRDALGDGALQLQFIDSRGLKVWPPAKQALCKPEGDLWRLRCVAANEAKQSSHQHVIDVLSLLLAQEIEVVKTEYLYLYDGALGFTLAQGE